MFVKARTRLSVAITARPSNLKHFKVFMSKVHECSLNRYTFMQMTLSHLTYLYIYLLICFCMYCAHTLMLCSFPVCYGVRNSFSVLTVLFCVTEASTSLAEPPKGSRTGRHFRGGFPRHTRWSHDNTNEQSQKIKACVRQFVLISSPCGNLKCHRVFLGLTEQICWTLCSSNKHFIFFGPSEGQTWPPTLLFPTNAAPCCSLFAWR